MSNIKEKNKYINIIEICAKEIEENHDKELFIVDFWTGEILDAAKELKIILNEEILDED